MSHPNDLEHNRLHLRRAHKAAIDGSNPQLDDLQDTVSCACSAHQQLKRRLARQVTDGRVVRIRKGNDMATKCQARNASGEPCQAIPLRGGDRCAWHDESLAEQRKQWSVAGGKNKSNSIRARKRLQRLELSEIDGALCLAMLYVLDGTLSPGVATAAATVARTIQQVRTATEHEQRIAELEALVLNAQKERTA